MYIKTERNDAQLSMSKICSRAELINEIKTRQIHYQTI